MKVEISITLTNNGQTTLSGIDLTAEVFKDGEVIDVNLEFSQNSLSSLGYGEARQITLLVDLTVEDVDNEIIITAISDSPSYKATEKIILDFIGEDESEVNKMVAFVSNMIVENPECLELKEMVNDATESFKQGDFKQAILKANNAVESCRASISGPKKVVYPSLKGKIDRDIILYLVVGTIVAIVFAIMFNIYKRFRFRKERS